MAGVAQLADIDAAQDLSVTAFVNGEGRRPTHSNLSRSKPKSPHTGHSRSWKYPGRWVSSYNQSNSAAIFLQPKVVRPPGSFVMRYEAGAQLSPIRPSRSQAAKQSPVEAQV